MLELLSLKALVPAALTAATLDVSSEKSLQLVPPSEEY
jgi:hypothetical protein